MPRWVVVPLLTLVVVLAVALALAVAGLGAAPHPCTRPDLPSGDQELVHGTILTCTDGRWHGR
jgi:hypothetical protein